MPVSANPISPAQLRFVRDLLTARAEVLQISDLDAFMAAQRIGNLTSKAAGQLIDRLQTIPTWVAQPAAVDTTPSVRLRTNSYPGQCHECGRRVPAGAGWIERIAGRWVTHHMTGQCTPAPASAEAKPAEIELAFNDLFIDDNGMVWKVYKTQNGYMGVKGTVPNMKGLHYKSGGIKVLRERIAAGTATKLTADEAAAFGKLHGFCCCCGKDIDDDRSLAAGYGPVCAGIYGFPYPTYEQAEAMLGRSIPRKGKKAVA